MKITRSFTFYALLFLLCMLIQPSVKVPSYAQSPTTSNDIIEPSHSLSSKVIDVTDIDNIFGKNPEFISVRPNDKRQKTALVPSIRTKLMAGGGGYQSQAMDYGWFFFSFLTGFVGLIIVLVGLIIGLIIKRKTLPQRIIFSGCLIILIAIGIGYATAGIWTQKPLVIFFDNASNSKYEVIVNEERFSIDEQSYLYEQIRWSSLHGSKEAILEIRIVSTTPNVEEVERLKIRVRPDRGYLYNIGGVNRYTIDTQTYGAR